MILPAVRCNLGIGFIPEEFAEDDVAPEANPSSEHFLWKKTFQSGIFISYMTQNIPRVLPPKPFKTSWLSDLSYQNVMNMIQECYFTSFFFHATIQSAIKGICGS